MKMLLYKSTFALVLLLVVMYLFSPGMNEFFLWFYPSNKTSVSRVESSERTDTEFQQLSKSIAEAEKKINVNVPTSPYIVINTTTNSFELYDKNGLVRKGLCSTGKNVQLERDSTKKWIFHTPKGMFKVKNKVTDPVWKKPDWAFVEEGLPIPSANSPLRYEYGVLGDYALILGDGYMIHGTLYQRFIGKPVTHGCVRLNDADLEAVYKNLVIGSKVFMY